MPGSLTLADRRDSAKIWAFGLKGKQPGKPPFYGKRHTHLWTKANPEVKGSVDPFGLSLHGRFTEDRHAPP